jgi:hypothetical protein
MIRSLVVLDGSAVPFRACQQLHFFLVPSCPAGSGLAQNDYLVQLACTAV